MRSGDVERNPGPQHTDSTIKSVNIRWEDGRTSWVKPYRVNGSSMDIGTLVKVKWGKQKRLFNGTDIGTEFFISVDSADSASPISVHSANQSDHATQVVDSETTQLRDQRIDSEQSTNVNLDGN
jgi:hypothetical protein